MTSVGWARWLEPLRNVARPVRALIRRLDHSVYLWLLRRVAPESRATADRRSIHLLVAGLGMGGTHRHIVALARGLVSRGFRCKVWVIEERGGSFTDEVRRTGATVDGVFTGLGPIGAFARLVYRLVTVPGVLLSLRLRKDTPLVLQCFHDEINIVGALSVGIRL